ncbi:hypothetical protein [Paenibacillus arenilitoris]|uniref:Uncharacterized protein n=1 Tax=Paenibacillus arenilitoris TaxID=2772299 RepID=A0A927H6A6_9BACL|nr:hypothetical protein [Paenibacillus arenilitoris]MBD2870346.1 hypothetical protein [Paenibacillus arenilitoris]
MKKEPKLQDDLPREELEKIVLSFTDPRQVRNVRYDGEGNSFPLYDETDLRDAKAILGVDVKFPLVLPDTELKISNSVLLREGDRNTGFAFRHGADALWNSYRAPYDSAVYDMNDELWLYQSKEPLFDAAKLSYVRTLYADGVEIKAYADPDHVYVGPSYLGNGHDKTKIRSQTYYFWKQNGIYYAACFHGLDADQEENVRRLAAVPAE